AASTGLSGALARALWSALLCPAGISGCGSGYGGTLEQLRVHSEHVGEDFDIQVYLPAGGVEAGERLPTVFQLDGRVQGASVAALAERDGHRVIVVAITAAQDVAASRFRDFTPTTDP